MTGSVVKYLQALALLFHYIRQYIKRPLDWSGVRQADCQSRGTRAELTELVEGDQSEREQYPTYLNKWIQERRTLRTHCTTTAAAPNEY